MNGVSIKGHSKGGNNVTSAFVMVEAAVRQRVVRIDNFDGPGVNEKFRERFAAGYVQLENKQAEQLLSAGLRDWAAVGT